MTTALITHNDCLAHVSPAGHPECEERLSVILRVLEEPEFDALKKLVAKKASLEQIMLVHPKEHIDSVFKNVPFSNFNLIDEDTYLSPGSGEAALRAAGAVCQAIDMVMAGEARNVFCASRPPGHHAEPNRAMGFCLFNSIAVGAVYAQKEYSLQRVAIIDFDVHHGNGTQTVAEQTEGLFYASTHQALLYPGTGHINDHGRGTIINVPLEAGSGSKAFREAFERIILPELELFEPSLILISAGFDAHKNDPLADINLEVEDYYYATEKLVQCANKHAKGRIISTLEGGYNLAIIGECAKAHVSALMNT